MLDDSTRWSLPRGNPLVPSRWQATRPLDSHLLGCEFDVHRPAELTEYLRALGARLTRAAGGRAGPDAKQGSRKSLTGSGRFACASGDCLR
ncbi:hypothetical protein GCM10009780_63100 [Actinomadura alba]